MNNLSNTSGKKTALITGASSGIGYEFAKVFASNGFNLILAARGKDALDNIAAELSAKHGITALVFAKDLSLPDAPDDLYNDLQKQGITVDILVNNAGFATYGYFTDIPLDKELQLLQLNIVALTHLTKLFLPGMKTRGYGKILNLASTAAFQPGPLMAVYYASKAYVLSFSEAISEELHGTGVSVTAFCPGPTELGFQKRAAMEESKLVQGGLMSAEAVAKIGYAGTHGESERGCAGDAQRPDGVFNALRTAHNGHAHGYEHAAARHALKFLSGTVLKVKKPSSPGPSGGRGTTQQNGHA